MKPSRNDPCPCGSGKKYKKCCLAKDEAAAPTHVPPPSRLEDTDNASPAHSAAHESPSGPEPESHPVPDSPKPRDPLRERQDRWWEEFEAAGFEERIAHFQRAIDQPGLLDDQLVYEALDSIRTGAEEPQQRDRVKQLLDALQQRLPHLYDSSRSFYLSWRMDEALAAGDMERIADLVRDMANSPKTNIDLFHRALDMLAYHGRLNVLVDVMRRAWPWIRDSKEILPWAVDEYAQRGAHYELFAYILERGDASADDAELLDRMRPFLSEVDSQRLAEYIDLLLGRDGREWKLADLHMGPGSKRREPVQAQDALYKLGVTFLGYLYRQEKVDPARGDMGREQIVAYLLDRHRGELRPRKGMLEEAIYPNKPPPPAFRPPEHPLCPDRQTLDMYVAQMFDPLTRRDFEAALTIEMVPAWLRFLESKGLIDAARRQKTLGELSRLKDDVLRLMTESTDPAMRRNLERWSEDAELFVPVKNT